MNLFHVPDLSDDQVELPQEEAHHALHVLRMKAGDLLGLLDGRGTMARAQLTEAGKHRVVAQVLDRVTHDPERTARIHLAVAPTKQMERFEWFMEKAVEVGVDRITPVLTARTERPRLRHDRLQRQMIAAMKQSRRTWLPQLDEALPLQRLLESQLPSQRYFGWCEGEHRQLMQVYTTASDAIVMIGPEGDLTQEEAALLKAKGFEAVGLGAARLRTETAAIAACTWMSLLQQR